MSLVDQILQLPGGVQTRIHVTGEQSGGAFTLMTDTAPPGWQLPPHRHANESETIHITSGALWLDLDGERLELRRGETAFVERGRLHSSGTLGNEPVGRIVVFSPAGLEHFFIALSATTRPEEGLRLATEHGWRFE